MTIPAIPSSYKPPGSWDWARHAQAWSLPSSPSPCPFAFAFCIFLPCCHPSLCLRLPCPCCFAFLGGTCSLRSELRISWVDFKLSLCPFLPPLPLLPHYLHLPAPCHHISPPPLPSPSPPLSGEEGEGNTIHRLPCPARHAWGCSTLSCLLIYGGHRHGEEPTATTCMPWAFCTLGWDRHAHGQAVAGAGLGGAWAERHLFLSSGWVGSLVVCSSPTLSLTRQTGSSHLSPHIPLLLPLIPSQLSHRGEDDHPSQAELPFAHLFLHANDDIHFTRWWGMGGWPGRGRQGRTAGQGGRLC